MSSAAPHVAAVDVSILMPCLNEEETLPGCIDNAKETLRQLQEKGFSREILISDNGSTDKSREIALQMDCRVIDCPDKGYGNAIIYGTTHARGKYIVMGDADQSYDFTESVAMVEKLAAGDDLCMGSRFMGKIMPGAMPWKNRYIGNPALSGILNLLFHSGLSDAHCGLRAYTRAAFDKMKLTAGGMEFASEMVVKATLLKLKRTEVPITLHADARNRAPHLRPWRDGWRHLKFLFLFSPKWLFFVPASVLLVASSGIFVVLIFFTEPGGVFELGLIKIGDHWAILAGGMLTMSCQLMMFGVGAWIYSVNNQFLELSHSALSNYLDIKLEYLLMLGMLLIAVGFGIIGYVAYIWKSSDTPGFYRIREMVVATTLIFIGVQVFFGSFFFSALGEEGKGIALAKKVRGINTQ